MDHLQLFATPVFVFDVPDTEEINPVLASLLLDESQQVPGLRRSNVGGWHSMPDLATRPEPCFPILMQRIVNHVGHAAAALARQAVTAGLAPAPAPDWLASMQWSVTAWGTVMSSGAYTELHEHGDAHWSVSYYVDAGAPASTEHPHSGSLAFVDPRRGGRPLPGLDLPSTIMVRPRTGLLVVFPGWMQHYVHSYHGAHPRVCIAANVTMTPGQAPQATQPAPGATP